MYVRDISEWLIRGFNGCVIGYGARNAGKTVSFFGSEPYSVNSSAGSMQNKKSRLSLHPSCSIAQILRLLFELQNPSNGLSTNSPMAPQEVPRRSLTLLEIAAQMNDDESGHGSWADELISDSATTTTSQSSNAYIGVSCWCLCQQQVVDLCASSVHNASPNTATSNDYAVVYCPTLEEALTVLATARSHIPHQGDNQNLSDEKNKSHVFVRITLHQRQPSLTAGSTWTSSVLHIVDLIGVTGSNAFHPNHQDSDRYVYLHVCLL